MSIEVVAIKRLLNPRTHNVTKLIGGVETSYDLTSNGVTRVEAAFKGIILPVDFINDTVTVNWGDFNVDTDTLITPSVFAYSSAYPKGEVLFGPSTTQTIYLRLIEDPRVIPRG